jgi:hypothetical protein
MTPKRDSKPKLTDAERYKRFLDAAKEVGASDDPKDFERAFDKIVRPKRPISATPKAE